jgi:hypothetical protein
VAKKVQTNFPVEFKMPTTCVACGAAAGKGMTWTINGTQTYGTGERGRTIKAQVDLPLCPACRAVSHEKSTGRWISVGGTVLVLALVWFGLTFLYPRVPEDSRTLATVIGSVVLGGMFFLARWIAYRLDTNELSSEQKKRRDRVRKSAAISGGRGPAPVDRRSWIEIRFVREDFAAEFARLNGGALL